MYFWRSLSILLVAALAAAQSPSFDFETLQTLQSDQGDLCLGLAEQLSSLRVEYESFAPSVSGSSAVSYRSLGYVRVVDLLTVRRRTR